MVLNILINIVTLRTDISYAIALYGVCSYVVFSFNDTSNLIKIINYYAGLLPILRQSHLLWMSKSGISELSFKTMVRHYYLGTIPSSNLKLKRELVIDKFMTGLVIYGDTETINLITKPGDLLHGIKASIQYDKINILDYILHYKSSTGKLFVNKKSADASLSAAAIVHATELNKIEVIKYILDEIDYRLVRFIIGKCINPDKLKVFSFIISYITPEELILHLINVTRLGIDKIINIIHNNTKNRDNLVIVRRVTAVVALFSNQSQILSWYIRDLIAEHTIKKDLNFLTNNDKYQLLRCIFGSIPKFDKDTNKDINIDTNIDTTSSGQDTECNSPDSGSCDSRKNSPKSSTAISGDFSPRDIKKRSPRDKKKGSPRFEMPEEYYFNILKSNLYQDGVDIFLDYRDSYWYIGLYCNENCYKRH
jgi:hypothetical protein